ncbi:MAG: hypothetical protein ABI972_31620 [Acidobacteriota bacterium]
MWKVFACLDREKAFVAAPIRGCGKPMSGFPSLFLLLEGAIEWKLKTASALDAGHIESSALDAVLIDVDDVADIAAAKVAVLEVEPLADGNGPYRNLQATGIQDNGLSIYDRRQQPVRAK